MNFTEESIAGATTALERLRRGYAALSEDTAAAAIAPAATVVKPASGERAGLGVEAYETRFFDALDDDMNTAGALGVLFDLISGLAKHPDAGQREGGAVLLYDALHVFGLGPLLDRPVEAERTVTLDPALTERLRALLGDALHLATNSALPVDGESPEAIVQAIIDARTAARKNKDFALGDRLRDALAVEGIALKDSKDGTTWTAVGA
jgi:cysteinyl-tRNA synthetase